MRILCALIEMGVLAGTAAAGQTSGLVVLDPSASGALTMVGNAVVQIPTKAVYVNSSAANAVRTSGNATLDTPNLFVVGGTQFNGNSGCTGTITRTGVPYQDPYSHLRIPSPAGMELHGSRSISGGSHTLQPGYYHGISISGNAEVTLAPGVYMIGGPGMQLTSGRLYGFGVTLVILSGNLSLAGNSGVQLTPPESGDLTGMVIVQPGSNGSEMSLAGGADMIIRGSIYAPGATVSLVGNSSIQHQGPLMGDIVVANRVSLAGTATIMIGGPEMQAIVPPKLPLAD